MAALSLRYSCDVALTLIYCGGLGLPMFLISISTRW